MPEKIEISHKTIIFTILFLLFLWLLFQIKEILAVIFIAFILMSALEPLVEKLEKFSLPRTFNILIIYLFFLSVLIFTLTLLVPPLISQSLHFGQNFPQYLEKISFLGTVDSQILIQQLTPLSENLFRLTVGIFGNIVSFFTVLVVSFYLLIGRKNLDLFLKNFIGEEGAEKIIKILGKVEERLGAWVRGQVTLGFFIGLATFLGLSFLNFPYILPLSIIAGILEIVPTIGPVISAIPAILIALTISPFLSFATVILYFLIQQIENHLVVPLVMKKVVGLPPLVTIISLLTGAKLAGIGGALLAVPFVLTLETIVGEYSRLKEEKGTGESS